MATTLIFGGSGKVARHITRILSSEGGIVHSIIRKEEQKPDIISLGGKPIVQSIEDSSVEDLIQTIQSTKPSTVIWAAGAGAGNPDRTQKVDHEGAVKAADATAKSGVTKRYIIISAVDVRDRERKPEPEWYNDEDRDRSNKVWGAIGPYMHAKFAADRDLVTKNGERKLEYTIVRPGGLSEDAGTGKIAAGKVHLNRTIPREDVARAVVECIKNDATKGLAFDLVGGDEWSVQDAVANVARERVDTFEGRY
ncbi:Putative NAD(P)-binding domain, NAD(P)-binding domain superfamily [Septoria linicola]|uniref:NAD(P)-binding domain, NAD(P)-binding domain superfamily n=1 Tax=Septoria linicola TaxID=215465 RepID=A0A9Q9AQ03_9PEZI|nr:putative NAD(P)-binding domain, NAD(P)-binding domain superfamily [Septoria linicola]USW50455.1 Putative NAD(P)-binding domain, NAD(P)-binding domain superfamily [Septoria linicola]